MSLLSLLLMLLLLLLLFVLNSGIYCIRINQTRMHIPEGEKCKNQRRRQACILRHTGCAVRCAVSRLLQSVHVTKTSISYLRYRDIRSCACRIPQGPVARPDWSTIRGANGAPAASPSDWSWHQQSVDWAIASSSIHSLSSVISVPGALVSVAQAGSWPPSTRRPRSRHKKRAPCDSPANEWRRREAAYLRVADDCAGGIDAHRMSCVVARHQHRRMLLRIGRVHRDVPPGRHAVLVVGLLRLLVVQCQLLLVTGRRRGRFVVVNSSFPLFGLNISHNR